MFTITTHIQGCVGNLVYSTATLFFAHGLCRAGAEGNQEAGPSQSRRVRLATASACYPPWRWFAAMPPLSHCKKTMILNCPIISSGTTRSG